MSMSRVNHHLPKRSTPIYPHSSMLVDMETVGTRLEGLRKAHKLTLEAAAKIAGTTKQSLSQIEKGLTQVPGGMAMEAWARHYGVNLRWLATGKGAKHPGSAEDDPDWASVTGYSQSVGLGEGEEAQEYARTHNLMFRASSLRKQGLDPKALQVFYGKGDSMMPRIRSGDAVLFDTTDTTPRDEALFVILVSALGGDGYSVKRCRHFGDDVYFDALNPEGDHTWRKPRKMNDKRHPIKILGRVRWIGSWEH